MKCAKTQSLSGYSMVNPLNFSNFKYVDLKVVEDSDKQPGNIWGNIYVGCFLGLLLSLGATVAISWPAEGINFNYFLTDKTSFFTFQTTFCICIILLMAVLMISDFLDEKYKWENGVPKRFILQVLLGFPIPFASALLVTYLCFKISDLDIVAFYYSRHLYGIVLSILFIYNTLCCIFNNLLNRPVLNIDPPDSLPVYSDYIWVKFGKEKIRLDMHKIGYFQLIGRSTLVNCLDGTQYTSFLSITYLESIVNPSVFLRANRAFIISVKSIAKMQEREDGGLLLYLKHKKKDIEISISRNKTKATLEWMEKEPGLSSRDTSTKHFLIPCL